MIALVISIIVMLILAGVSISAIVGEDGVISKDWIYNPSAEGYGSSKYIVNADGKAIYLFNKNNLPEEVQNRLVGGNAKDGSYYNYYNMNDVYGITSNLKIYYCENGSDSISGINYNELDQDNPSRIVIESGSKLSNLLNDGNEMSLSQVKTVNTLTLDNNNISDISGLKDLTQLETLYIRNNCLYDDALKIFLNMNQNGSLKNLYISGNSSIIDISILNQGNWEGKDW